MSIPMVLPSREKEWQLAQVCMSFITTRLSDSPMLRSRHWISGIESGARGLMILPFSASERHQGHVTIKDGRADRVLGSADCDAAARHRMLRVLPAETAMVTTAVLVTEWRLIASQAAARESTYAPLPAPVSVSAIHSWKRRNAGRSRPWPAARLRIPRGFRLNRRRTRRRSASGWHSPRRHAR